MQQIPRGRVIYPIHVRLSEEQLERLGEMAKASGLSFSMIIRHLIDQATLKPAIIRTEAPVANGQREPAK